LILGNGKMTGSFHVLRSSFFSLFFLFLGSGGRPASGEVWRRMEEDHATPWWWGSSGVREEYDKPYR